MIKLLIIVKRWARGKGSSQERQGGPAAPGVGQFRLLHPVGVEVKAELYLIEITPRATLPVQFFSHKGEELVTIII